MDGQLSIISNADKFINSCECEEDKYSELPMEMIVKIFSRLNGRDLSSLALVCKKWSIAVNDDSIWRSFCQRRGIQQIPGLTWKESVASRSIKGVEMIIDHYLNQQFDSCSGVIKRLLPMFSAGLAIDTFKKKIIRCYPGKIQVCDKHLDPLKLQPILEDDSLYLSSISARYGISFEKTFIFGMDVHECPWVVVKSMSSTTFCPTIQTLCMDDKLLIHGQWKVVGLLWQHTIHEVVKFAPIGFSGINRNRWHFIKNLIEHGMSDSAELIL